MISELSSFAARVREFISCCAEDPQASREDEFNELAFALFALQFEHNSPYRKFCEARQSVPGVVKRWSQIPAVPTPAFKELELTCLPPEVRTKVFHSSGTTEQRPSRHFHSAESPIADRQSPMCRLSFSRRLPGGCRIRPSFTCSNVSAAVWAGRNLLLSVKLRVMGHGR
jgi:hypothetical protein